LWARGADFFFGTGTTFIRRDTPQVTNGRQQRPGFFFQRGQPILFVFSSGSLPPFTERPAPSPHDTCRYSNPRSENGPFPASFTESWMVVEFPFAESSFFSLRGVLLSQESSPSRDRCFPFRVLLLFPARLSFLFKSSPLVTSLDNSDSSLPQEDTSCFFLRHFYASLQGRTKGRLPMDLFTKKVPRPEISSVFWMPSLSFPRRTASRMPSTESPFAPQGRFLFFFLFQHLPFFPISPVLRAFFLAVTPYLKKETGLIFPLPQPLSLFF